MSHLTDLINQLCPDGVEYRKLGNVCELVRGKGLSKSDKDTGDAPIILYGELYTTYGDYINEVVSHANADVAMGATKIYWNDLLMPVSSTTKEAQIGRVSVYMCDHPAYLGGDAIILRHKLNAAYLMYLLNGSWFEQLKMQNVRGTTISHLNINNLLKLEIPIPPLPIQAEIVRILDNFTELQTELQTELTLRQKQYEYYRNQLLTFDPDDPTVEWKKLGEVCVIKSGGTPASGRSDYYGGEIKWAAVNDVTQSGRYIYNTAKTITNDGLENSSAKIFTPNTLLLTIYATLGAVSITGCEMATNQAILGLTPNSDILDVCYLYYLMQSRRDDLLEQRQIGSQNNLNKGIVSNYIIPIPPLSTQQRIVNILDKFSDYTTSLTNGLPAEIKLRQQQYEYYRDKLLTFKHKEA